MGDPAKSTPLGTGCCALQMLPTPAWHYVTCPAWSEELSLTDAQNSGWQAKTV